MHQLIDATHPPQALTRSPRLAKFRDCLSGIVSLTICIRWFSPMKNISQYLILAVAVLGRVTFEYWFTYVPALLVKELSGLIKEQLWFCSGTSDRSRCQVLCHLDTGSTWARHNNYNRIWKGFHQPPGRGSRASTPSLFSFTCRWETKEI